MTQRGVGEAFSKFVLYLHVLLNTDLSLGLVPLRIEDLCVASITPLVIVSTCSTIVPGGLLPTMVAKVLERSQF